MQAPLVAVAVLAAVMQPVSAFLPTNLNYSDPEVEAYFCPALMSENTWDHKAITREALRREVRRFLLESASGTNITLTIPEDASLTQIFRAYYGPKASPTRFIKAVNSITWSNAMTEAAGHLRFRTAYHMDGESILEGHKLLQGRYQELVGSITMDQAYPFARELLGTSLNGIQDFYSQTTWVELGRDGTLENLGLPGADIGDIAGPGDPVCTSCDSPTGECRNNVIPGSLLSSGYYEYEAFGAEEFVVQKPKDAGKCSHGGLMDSSVNVAATGGINKETSSPCFSPHYYLHQQAVDAAITASEHYLAQLRDAIGNEHFHNLLDLYLGSALSIIIDTTGSMTYEIKAVKEKSREIVEKSHPDLYVLVPYGDPTIGPVTETMDSEVFLEELDKLEAFGGCCCLEEKFWHGLQLALTNTPDYSSIYCFTDAGSNDAELMDSILALALAKRCKVTVVYSYNNNTRESSKERGVSDCEGYQTSGVDEYKQLAILTGGTFVEIDKLDVDEVLGIMDEGVQQSEVSLQIRDTVVGRQNISFPIDDSISLFGVALSGELFTAVLSHSSGISYDLTNQVILEGSEGVEIMSHTPLYKYIRFINHSLGEWSLELDGSSEYTVAVTALSSLSFLPEFCLLELSPPRPGYKVLLGYPITGSHYYIEVTLVGYVESEVDSVNAIKFVSETGEVQSLIEYDGVVDDHFYALSEPIPSNPFYVQVDGFLSSGQAFTRISSTMVISVMCSVELLVDKSEMTAQAGHTAIAYFRVDNYGPLAIFDFFATDEKKIVSEWEPAWAVIPEMGSVNITVLFRVPETHMPGSVSTVTVTASSRAHEYNVNSAISHFYVLFNEVDEKPPLCFSSSLPSCEGHNTWKTCSESWWSAEATLQDNESGLSTIYSNPEETLTVDSFLEGATHPINVTFSTSCCVQKAEVIGRDQLGNIGKCEWDIGILTDTVVEFVAEAVGESWVYLRWNVSEVQDDFDKYTVLIDEDYTDSSRCPELVCYLNVTYLDPCSLHTFTLTPHYRSDEGMETLGTPLNTDATTLGPVPEVPTNPSVDYVGETTTSLSWTPPSNLVCLDHYTVCLRMFGSTEIRCETTNNNYITLKGLEACTVYHINITSVSISGQQSEDFLTFDTNTNDAAPGAPQNLMVNNQTAKWVSLSWDDPLVRASCVKRWMISSEEDVKLQEVEVLADNHATISDLLPCSKYIFFVSGVSPGGAQGSTETTTTVMDEIEPTAVESVEATAVDATSVMAVWIPATLEECVHHYLVCITELVTLTQQCHNSTDIHDTFTGLEACLNYEVTVTSVAPSGRLGTFMYDITRTMDLPTGPPTSLEVTDITPHSAQVSFKPPLENPQCVVEYDIEIEETGRGVTTKSLSISVLLQQIVSGLNACTGYEVRVSAVTAYGIISEKVNSSFTTTEDTPSAPRILTHMAVAADQVQLHWFAPLMNPMCVGTYKLSWTSGTDSGNMDYTPSGHPPEITVTVSGLESCSPYTFTVLAVTLLGDAGPSTSYTVSTNC